jgi:hypothetical protein
MAVKYSGWGNQQFFDENGDPASGWKIYTYAAGSSTLQATYTTETGDVAQSNPIVLNSLGFPTNGQIWLTEGLTYKLVLKNASDVEKKTEDNISGVNDTSSTTSQWRASGITPTYISATSFSAPGDQTVEFHAGRKLRFTTAAGTVYGEIASSAYTTLTTVTMTMTLGMVLDSGLSEVSLSLLRADQLAQPFIFPRIVDSLAALKALDKTRFSRAQITGSDAAIDGGGNNYYLDLADTTSTDNGGSVIVATDGGRWKAVPQRLQKTQDAAGWALQVTKDASPLNYSNTRAASILQHRDTAAGATDELIPGAVDQFNVSGNGTVNSATELSQTIWQGRYVYMSKTGDGSAHCATGIGQLGAVGPGGYNELGGFQAELTNTGSALGTMSGVEMLLKDSPNGGTSTYSTKMQAVVGRIAKYNSTIRKSHNFYASSEGTIAIDAVLGVNPTGLATWQRGFDFQGAVFSTGQFGLAPNNTFLAWLRSDGTARSILGVSNTNNTILAAANTTNKVAITNSALASRLEVDNATNDAVLIWVGGVLKRIGQGAADSAGAGFRTLVVPN